MTCYPTSCHELIKNNLNVISAFMEGRIMNNEEIDICIRVHRHRCLNFKTNILEEIEITPSQCLYQ